ncbi:MAG: hypothetical protein AB7P20_11420 [Rhizobiaceae bacterium]
MPKGGTRPGAGRPVGRVAKRHLDVAAEAVAAGQTPLERLLEIMRDDKADEKRRDWATEKAAVYLHPRPAPIAQRVEIDLPEIGTPEGVTLALTQVAKAVASGQLAPSEGQSLIAIIEAQRKAIDIQDMMDRIERLEQSAPGAKPNGQYRKPAH